MAVDKFVVGHPQGVIDRLHAIEVMHIAGSYDKLRTNLFCHLPHQLSDGLLVIVSVASQVVCHVYVEFVFVDAVVYRLLGHCPCAHEGNHQ